MNYQKNLNIMHWNCHNMTDFRSNALQIFINDLKSTCKSLDIICLNEVKLNLEEANLRLNFDGYQFILNQDHKTLHFAEE